MFFEQAREAAEREFAADGSDALALTKWGGALLELAHFRQGAEAAEMIEEAVGKFEGALALDAARHDALWCLGNAYTSQGFLSADAGAAGAFFERAGACFERAAAAEPGNESYRRALDMSAKAPQLYAELQRQLAAAGGGGGGGGGSGGRSPRGEPAGRGGGGGARARGARAISDSWYDAAGWAVLVSLGFGVAALSRGK
jgi:hypothetical protein